MRYVWGQAGANTGGLTGYSGSFCEYGISHGTWKTATAIPKVGDAVVWRDATSYAHVAIVSAVSGSTFRILHGGYIVGFASPVP